jgi:hypothetical protein
MTYDIARVYEFNAFVDGLAKAGAGVVRVETDLSNATMNTGWLVTDSLVVLPGYCLGPPEATYTCTIGPKRVAAAVEHIPSSSDLTRPALLRLREPLEGCALRLHVSRGTKAIRSLCYTTPVAFPNYKSAWAKSTALQANRVVVISSSTTRRPPAAPEAHPF